MLDTGVRMLHWLAVSSFLGQLIKSTYLYYVVHININLSLCFDDTLR